MPKRSNGQVTKRCVIDFTDGISMEFSEWRFNLRSSNEIQNPPERYCVIDRGISVDFRTPSSLQHNTDNGFLTL